MQSDLFTALDPVVSLFIDLNVPWHIGGSVASSVYGVARTTLDVNLVAGLRSEHAHQLAARLEPDYYADEQMIRGAIQRCGSFNLIHLATMIKIDVFILKANTYDQLAMLRTREDTLATGENARVYRLASAEDVILNKLAWFRAGGEVSERQWLDVRGVLQVQQRQLDYDYLEKWAAQLGVTDLLRRAIAGANP